MGEFSLIERIRQRAVNADPSVIMGIGDDAAILMPTPGRELVMTTDTLNAGVHFEPGVDARLLGHKALAVNLSDLAAMGAEPSWALLSLSLPGDDRAWIDAFLDGFLKLATGLGVTLVGGDTCSGAFSVGVTAVGQVKTGKAIRRDGAQPGDLVVVSGVLGDAALALSLSKTGFRMDKSLFNALHCPLPRVALGKSLVEKASACIDISDGLCADLGHICVASAVGAEIELAKLPASGFMLEREERERWNLQLSGGDDYELCFTIPTRREHELATLSSVVGLPLSVIGRISGQAGIRYKTPEGKEFQPDHGGYEHFR
jgi:thiamine-monophosphate kinase